MIKHKNPWATQSTPPLTSEANYTQLQLHENILEQPCTPAAVLSLHNMLNWGIAHRLPTWWSPFLPIPSVKLHEGPTTVGDNCFLHMLYQIRLRIWSHVVLFFFHLLPFKSLNGKLKWLDRCHSFWDLIKILQGHRWQQGVSQWDVMFF